MDYVPSPQVLDLLEGLEPPEGDPMDARIPARPKALPPAVVDAMMEAENDPEITRPPQAGRMITYDHAGRHDRLRFARAPMGRPKPGVERNRHGKNGRKILIKETQAGDVALWIALGHTYQQISESLGCHLMSLTRWVSDNPKVREAARVIRKELLDRVEGSVVDKAGKAVEKLDHLMQHSPSEEIQMRSAKILLDKAFELRPEKKAPLVAIQNNSSTTVDLSKIPSGKLKEILEEELKGRQDPDANTNGKATQEAGNGPSCDFRGVDGLEDPQP